MPGRDRTGPRGEGPMTGRGFGVCAGDEKAGSAGPTAGYGMRPGGGWGRRGRRRLRRFYAAGLPFGVTLEASQLEPEQELAGLKRQAEVLSQQIEAVKRRIEELGSQEQ